MPLAKKKPVEAPVVKAAEIEKQLPKAFDLMIGKAYDNGVELMAYRRSAPYRDKLLYCNTYADKKGNLTFSFRVERKEYNEAGKIEKNEFDIVVTMPKVPFVPEKYVPKEVEIPKTFSNKFTTYKKPPNQTWKGSFDFSHKKDKDHPNVGFKLKSGKPYFYATNLQT